MLFVRSWLTPRQLRRLLSCWSCNAASQEVICSQCGKIQPPQQEVNYFKVLHQEEKFTLRAQDLQKRFRDMQRVLHPDKFANCSEKEKNFSADQSALVNQAYQVLLKPIQRATYLLQLKGISLAEVQLSQEFLLEMMEFNEEIDRADDSKREELLGQIAEFEELAMAELQEHFANKKLSEASESLAKLKYFENLRNRLS
ncbi:iron-sulfur cluster co-chaperone protein HscB [Galendromus occidentalis]|uniref:Iron-sulfur cluster co-chaperone protein HscB n=1 Tax=Galendromus occidentalis TaxID=34638 RepID=A0AAJ6QLQ7_9ACAR|nr:iron-sulfur cluster co-chaperone protein HscB [Galendromus occidentalis]